MQLNVLKVAAAVVFMTGLSVPALADECFFQEIENLLKEKKYEAALAAATNATQEYPKSSKAYFLLGRTHFYKEEDSAAKDALDKAINLDSTIADAWFFRGLIYAYGEQITLARPDFETAIRLNPQDPKYWFEFGKLAARTRKVDEAIASFRKVIDLDPKSAPAWFSIGTLASVKGEHARAVNMWQKALEIDSTYAIAHYNLGVHNQLRGDPEIALKHFLAVFELNPGDAEGIKKVIQAYYRLEDFEKAGAYRLRLLNLIATSKDPAIRNMKEFCFDQFDSPGGVFFAYESLKKDQEFGYRFTFKLVRDERVIKTINLESSGVLREQGVQFVLGQNEGVTHKTFDVYFKSLPPHPELKKLVLEADAGRITSSISSIPSLK
jgi:tetratricopeptide (TPR) repeat protein